MKKTIIRLLYILLCMVTITSSCSREDDDLQLTGLNGKPSSIGYDNDNKPNRNVYFYYQGDKLSEIKELKGSVTRLNYENNELVSVDFSPEDKEVMDGHGSVLFKKEGRDKIIIESWAEPSLELFRMEMKLDENNLPLKITESGFYSYNGAEGEFSKTVDGFYYAVFTYEPSTNNLLRQTIYTKDTDAKVVSYEYEYDSNMGAISEIDLPLWYYVYQAYRNKNYRNAYNRLFFNYTNNLIKETVHAEGTADGDIFHYTYQYNHGKIPVFMEHDIAGIPSIFITY
ncbi:hypothetical protein [uncultured Proteiniphilum sp.]|uniref:hypothetical protein n=1 Tax=uncultured Proteiniphilum sp. TaxID=497637 RepID=UPI00261E2CF2|nr:hypothetical protein [uncultured Proteiniphilum sp.]